MYFIKDLVKHYGTKKILNELNLEIEPHKVTGIIGPNGAGKSTLIKCLWSLNFEKGEINFNNEKIAYLAELPVKVKNTTLKEFIKFRVQWFNQSQKTDESKINEQISYWQLEPHLSKNLEALSKGTLQKASLISLFACEAKILILDEPLSGLDPISQVDFRNLILKNYEEKTILMTSHQLSDLEKIIHNVVLINKGEIIHKASIDAIKSKYKDLDLFYYDKVKGFK